MTERLRMLLPTVVGGLSIPLIFWDIHNARVIESMGMAWDMGPPIWPYQASDILLRLLNGPAYSIAMPIANVLRLPAPLHFIVVVPFHSDLVVVLRFDARSRYGSMALAWDG